MNKELLIRRFGNWIANKTKGNKNEIAIGIGLVGFGVAMYFMHDATKKAEKIELPKDATRKEKFKAVAPIYIYPTIAFIGATTCVVAGASGQKKKIASLASACTFTATAYNEYRDKVVETIGEKKERDIREKVYEERMERNNDHALVYDEVGGFLCYDPLSSHYFRIDRNRLERVVEVLNDQLNRGEYVSMNDFYYEIGIGGCDFGDWFGWCNRFDNEIAIDIKHDAGKTYPPTGESAALLVYYTEPRPGYDNDI